MTGKWSFVLIRGWSGDGWKCLDPPGELFKGEDKVILASSHTVNPSPDGSDSNESACRRPGFNPWRRKIPLEKGMATHSSMFAWRIPWTEEPDRLQSMGWQSQTHNCVTNSCTFRTVPGNW